MVCKYCGSQRLERLYTDVNFENTLIDRIRCLDCKKEWDESILKIKEVTT